MSEYGLGRETDAGEVPVATGGGEPWFERGAVAAAAEPVGRGEPAEPVELTASDEAESGEPSESVEPSESIEPAESAEPVELVEEPADPIDEPAADAVEEYADPYADPQEWISSLVAKVERAEQGIGSGPRDALMARIKLAQAYSELGDTVQAAPLAVKNVAQAEHLFPSSEGMLRQLREFRDAACEAAGWTAAMMRESAEEMAMEEPSELVTWPGAVAAAEPAATAEAAESASEPAEQETPAPAPVAESMSSAATSQAPEAEPAGAVIHEFVRRSPEPDALQWAAEVQAALTQPAELAIPAPPEPEYAEEVEPAMAAADLADLSDLADLAAIEEIIRLRYELREAQRTIERLRHVNRKLREALEFDEKA